MVGRRTSLWQIHQTLLACAKKEQRIQMGQIVLLSKEEADILDLPADKAISAWMVLGRLPRFFI
jgi:hypothetical protein